MGSFALVGLNLCVMVTRDLAGKLGDENIYYRYSITEFSLAYLSFFPFLKKMHSYVFK